MAKIFRKIRQTVFTDNRFSKYLLYALGEILLLSIGILLALQVSSWNESRLNSIKEKKYYFRLLDDVLLDEVLVSEQLQATQDRLNGANIMIKALQSDPADMDAIAQGIMKSVSMSDWGLNPTQTTFEDIKSSGNIQLITDIALRNQLDQYYAFMKGLMQTISNNASGLGPRMYTKKDLLGTGLFHITKRQNAFDPNYVDIGQLDSQSELTKENKIVLLNDAIFYAGMTARNIYHFESMMEKVQEMKGILQEKCNQFN